MTNGPAQNTDREIWRERENDYYADSIHVTQQGAIGINCGGRVYVMPVRAWHRLAMADEPAPPADRPKSQDELEAECLITEHTTQPCGPNCVVHPFVAADSPDTPRLEDWIDEQLQRIMIHGPEDVDTVRLAAEVADALAATRAERDRLITHIKQPHYQGAPMIAGGGFDKTIAMVSRDWHKELLALAEPPTP